MTPLMWEYVHDITTPTIQIKPSCGLCTEPIFEKLNKQATMACIEPVEFQNQTMYQLIWPEAID